MRPSSPAIPRSEVFPAVFFPPKSRARLKKLLFRVLAVTLPILAIEAAARVYWSIFLTKPTTESSVFWDEAAERSHDDSVPPYAFLPNQTFPIAGTLAHTNNLGLRGSVDIDLDRQYEGLRILCVGDSVTFGYTVSDDLHTYPSQLEQRLREKHIDCQVLNAGFPRYRLQHLAIYLEDQLADLQPDILILLAGWNNVADQIMQPQALATTLQWVNQHCFAVRVVQSWQLLTPPEIYRHSEAQISELGMQKYRTALERIVQLANRQGVQVYVCTLPHFFEHVDTPEAHRLAAQFCPPGSLSQLSDLTERLTRVAQEVAAESELRIIDLGSVDRPEYFEDAVHPGDSGSAKIADIVAESLRF